jgi:glycosyltransferase involved in cell wall biosynthesis
MDATSSRLGRVGRGASPRRVYWKSHRLLSSTVPEFIWGMSAKMSRGLLEGRMNISAIIPLYNGGKYIRGALDSVLRQDRPADEIIVVDDGSTDDGASIVAEMAASHPSIKLVSKPNGGQSSARNFGVRHSKGDLIALLDQDDEWYPHHLRILEQPFKETRSIPLGWAYSNLDQVDVLGRMMTRSVLDTVPNTQHPKRDVLNCLGRHMFVLPGASIISRSAFDSVAGFDEQFVGYEDDDLFLRLFVAGFDNIYINEPLTKWRMHSTSTSFSEKMARSRALYFEKLKRNFPDEPNMARFYIRDHVAPRFTKTAIVELISAITRMDRAAAKRSAEQIRYFAKALPARRRLPAVMVSHVLATSVMQAVYRSAPKRLVRVARRALGVA